MGRSDYLSCLWVGELLPSEEVSKLRTEAPSRNEKEHPLLLCWLRRSRSMEEEAVAYAEAGQEHSSCKDLARGRSFSHHPDPVGALVGGYIFRLSLW